MFKIVLSPSKLLIAIKETLRLAISPEVKIMGEMQPEKNQKSQRNRLLFSLDSPFFPKLMKKSEEADFWQYQGTGTLIFFNNSFNSTESATLSFSQAIKAVSEGGHQITLGFEDPFSFEHFDGLEHRGYQVSIPFRFFATIKESVDSLGFLSEFSFKLEELN